MIQRITPQLVKDVSRLETVRTDFGFDPAYRGWTTKDRTKPGHMGSPQFANPEKGEHLLSEFSDGVGSFLRTVIAWDGQAWD